MKIKFLNATLKSLILFFCIASVAQAGLITVSELQNQDVGGQNFNFSFNGLDLSNGTGGTFTVHARGDFSDSSSQTNETLSWDIESIFSASGIGGFNSALVGLGGPFTNVTEHVTSRNIEFTRTWNISALDLDNMLSDNVLEVFVDFASGVGALETPRYVEVIISYNSMTSVPEPSTLAIFALGMIGLASRRFKKQS